ncbi:MULTISPECIES: LysR substrate-binding domain-containing protein [Aquitalea]|uniref:LysR family transcriptional regulator n=1 Tax=Aquitalea magnusonii TaxID=332411 RepID=A0A318JKL4_9NEIS|nr:MULTISPECIES: LysR substrate-binding domain-containing protein [Aquitalea]PXX51155.1 LysR family transcriptional regulator [Aquitalea magnusonii]
MIPLALDLNDLFLFSQVVQRQGFSAAARSLGLPKSRLSRRVSLLEERLGARLLQRNARNLRLTDAGAALYAHCLAMLAEAQAGEAAVRQRQQEPSGQVRLSVPIAIADAVLSRLLPDFMQRYPKVKLSVQASNRQVDLLEEGVDVVVRGVGFEQASSSLVQVSLCTAQWGLLATPAWLAQLGDVLSPQQLEGCGCLQFAPLDGGTDVLLLRHDSGSYQDVRVNVLLRSDNVQTLKQAALAGLGLAGLPLYSCAEELAAGRLQLLLPQWRPKDGRLVMLYPTRRGLSPAVRVLIDFFKQHLPDLLEYRACPGEV